ncbi:MAG: hypothetical protein ACOCQR_01415 [bacterium]
MAENQVNINYEVVHADVKWEAQVVLLNYSEDRTHYEIQILPQRGFSLIIFLNKFVNGGYVLTIPFYNIGIPISHPSDVEFLFAKLLEQKINQIDAKNIILGIEALNNNWEVL